jgi:two-component system sensor histidine kinase KdpD
LALARRIVQAHGGSLTAHAAQPGPGAVLEMALPVLDQPALD